MTQDNQRRIDRPETRVINSPNTRDKISVQSSPVEGSGVFANKQLHAGERIAYFEGNPTPHSTQHSLTVDGKHIEPTGMLKNLNHSCDPSAYFFKRWLIAGRDIEKGEEINIDYALTEESFSFPFQCDCGSEKCRGHIQ